MILTVNTGSSSVRLAAFEAQGEALECREQIKYGRGEGPPDDILRAFLERVEGTVDAVAHRVVHGGETFQAPTRIDDGVEAQIETLTPLAPLHNPAALEWIRAARALLDVGVPHVGVFDTTFFAHLPPAARFYALPPDLCRRYGIRRYGFHGLAHQAMWERWCAMRPDLDRGGRVITVQLGSGCSMAAIKAGRPMDTTMGFSPTEGLVMATRSGDVDPGAITYLIRQCGMSAEDVERVLNEDAGLRGVSALSGDVRWLLDSDAAGARLALGLYYARARKYLGAFLAVLGGADGIVFGGGVGEHQPVVRAKIGEGMAWCGIELDATRNAAATGREARISADGSSIDVRVLPVDEAQILAREAQRILQAA